MNQRRVALWSALIALLLAALWVGWSAAAARRAALLRAESAAIAMAARRPATMLAPAQVPPAVWRGLADVDGPVEDGGSVYAPVKDADDWDAIGAVKLPLPRVRAAELLRGSVLWPIAALLALWALFVSWSARAGERRRRAALTAWGFLSLPMLHLAVFSFAPVLFTLFLSVHRWDLVSSARPFVGLANYRELAGDPLFWTTVKNTALYVLYVPVTMVCALGLAVLLNRRRGGEKLLRAVVFLPYVTSTVAIALVWQWLMNADFGLVNYALRLVHLPAVDWLGSPRSALIAIIAVTVWTQVGYQMVVFLAGLQGLPQAYLDAALVDGATPWQRFRHVTLPLLRPVLLFVLVTGIISGFQVFTLVYLMTEGGPLHATDVIVYRIYQTAWEFLRFGSASAMAVVLFVILLAVTIVQFKLLGRRIEHV